MALCRQPKSVADSEEHPCDPTRREDFYHYDSRGGDLVGSLQYTQDLSAPSSRDNRSEQHGSVYKYKSIRPGSWRLYYLHSNSSETGALAGKERLNVSYTGVEFTIKGQGGVYALILTGSRDNVSSRELPWHKQSI